ncbi:MAG: hypothetical protein MJ153_00470 [Clostridia bacterium]|nr:hypothetical protein [Clostridia bacterium]
MEKYHKQVPDTYYEPSENGGTITSFTYNSVRSDNGEPCTKRALVYLPKGYDQNADAYNVLYLMHGGGGNEEEFLYGQDNQRALINIIDHMIDSKELDPLVIVAPTFYYERVVSAGHDISECGRLTAKWSTEFRNDLIPAAESLYNIRTDREGRIFGGFSMGSCTTWRIFTECLDLVKNFIPLSGDSWIICEKGGAVYPKETVARIAARIKENNFDSLSYNIFAATGNQDIAFPALDAQINTMFDDNWNTPSENRNLRYFTWPEGVHDYKDIYKYMYNLLPDIFNY